ncbi:AlpA family transcriptional regulator [Sinobacterium caligoides]|uniref:AlpA family transcriptional regulator n=1 Tax=Sinobacterium caligoides TaxID=933926 RepID=A0A3N2E0U6_9GAMM|nr:AlpA family phage regulatory protein [Sinobacterium caligoides]ROS05728.1 AlpA family transcriptional regulator [Sinobacterium caligoides]
MNTSNITPERILKLAEVKSRTSCSTTFIYEKISTGEFPKQLQITPRSVGWLESEINGWIAEKAAQRIA